MDYAPTDTGTEPNISSVFYRPRDQSRGVSTKSSLATKKPGKRKFSQKKVPNKKVALVGQ